MVAQTPNPFWSEVKAQALAGMMVAGAVGVCGGLGYLIHTVPRQLEQILNNQMEFKGRLESVERKVDDQDNRLIRLESNR